jgi:hypothetical protein
MVIAATGPAGSVNTWRYALEDVYVDQDPDLVVDSVPALLAWLNYMNVKQPVRVSVAAPSVNAAPIILELTWNLVSLAAKDANVTSRADRMIAGRTSQREHVTELAAYLLAMVAISIFLPGQRVRDFRRGAAPDLLLDATPGALRGVEVAGRKGGGFSKLRTVRLGTPARAARRSKRNGKRSAKRRAAVPGKAAQLQAMSDVVEAHLSLWCASPLVSEFICVKP